MLEIEQLSVAYGEIEAVSRLDLTVPDGEIVALLGRNGAGKTTTLKSIIGLIGVKRGSVVYNGVKLNGLNSAQIAARGVAYVPEGRGIFAGMTVWENMAAAAYGAGMKRREAATQIERRMELFPILVTRTGQRAGTMSGGEQQMLAVARSLVARPSLLLLDEPGLGLAPIIVQELYRHFVRLNREEGLSILLVEQYVDLALRTASRATVMEKGRMVYETGMPDVDDDRARVAEFIS
jgi:branched-chain amino acid transport system ATP-binding protein